MELPKRQSLVGQTADILRESIRSGEWSLHLPTEAQLQERLQVGRNTVRAALEILTREKWIEEGCPGRRREIAKNLSKARPSPKTRTVALLAPDVLERARTQVVLTVNGLREHLSEMGYRLELHTSKAFRLNQPERTLATLLRKSPADLWILQMSTQPMQKWFLDHNIPCLIYGSAHPNIPLPCIDIDYGAITTHSVGALLGKGHCQLALLLPNRNLVGNVAAENAFLEAMEMRGTEGEVVRVENDKVSTLRKTVERLMTRPDRPTGILVWHVRYAMALYGTLQQMGLRIPQDLSVICMDDASTAEWLVPSLARYQVKQPMIVNRLFRATQQILLNGAMPDTRVMLLPDYVEGGSLGAAQT